MRILFAINRAAYVCKKIWEGDSSNIPFRDLLILFAIEHGNRKKKEISDRLMRDKSSVSREIDNLKKKGYLISDNKDYYLNDKSQKIIEKANQVVKEIEEDYFLDTTLERKTDFFKKLLKLEDGLINYLNGSKK